jgi:hypothetical protein
MATTVFCVKMTLLRYGCSIQIRLLPVSNSQLTLSLSLSQRPSLSFIFFARKTVTQIENIIFALEVSIALPGYILAFGLTIAPLVAIVTIVS